MKKKGMLTGNFLMDVALWIGFLIIAGAAVYLLMKKLTG